MNTGAFLVLGLSRQACPWGALGLGPTWPVSGRPNLEVGKGEGKRLLLLSGHSQSEARSQP